MKVRPLVIDDSVKARVAAVQQYASDHRIPLHDLIRRMGHPEKPVGLDPNLRLEIPFGYHVVYSIEQQERGWTHHISIAVDQIGPKPLYPSEYAVKLAILPLFGLDFKDAIYAAVEEPVRAVNLIFPMKEP